MGLLESAVLQETHLSGFFAKIVGPGRAEFFFSDLPREIEPVLFGICQDLSDQSCVQTALTQIGVNPHGPLSLADTGLQKILDKSPVILQAIRAKPGNGCFRNCQLEAGTCQFAAQLPSPVFASRKIIHGFFARLGRVGKALVLLRLEEVGIQLIDRLRFAQYPG